MQEFIDFFPIVLYLLGSVLLVILIILGIKLIHTVDKTNEILEDAYNKTKSLNGFFEIIDSATDTLSSISDSIVGVVTTVVNKLFYRNKKKKEEEDEDE